MNDSYWILSSEKKDTYKSLHKDIDTECLIVGGGLAGMTTAYLLSKENKKVVVVEGGEVGQGVSGRNTGKVTSQHGIIYSKISKQYSKEKAKLYYEANEEGKELIKNIIKENNIDCNFKTVSSFVYTEDENYVKDIEKEYKKCEELNIPCKKLDSIKNVPLNIKGALEFENQGQFNPKKYVDSLAIINKNLGVKIYENTPIVDVTKNEEDEKYVVTCSNEKTIKCDNLILCSCNAWYDGLKFFFAKEEASRVYLLCGKLKTKIPEGNYLSIEKPTRTFRTYENDKKENLIIAGGQDHKTGKCNNEEENYKIIENFAKDTFDIEKIITKWSTQDYVSTDNIPYIGEIRKNVYIITGTSKWGITNTSAGAIVIKDLITKNKSKYEDLYNPSRLKSYLNTTFLENNLQVTFDYIKSKFMGTSKEMPKKNEGKVVKIDGKRYGAYRDEKGELYVVDITCTHVGCELSFNSSEKSWDCPCHGSRFSYTGEILNGPALKPLKRYGSGDNDIKPKFI